MRILKALIVLGLAVVTIVSIAGFLYVQLSALKYLIDNVQHLTAVDYFLGITVTSTCIGLGCTGIKAVN